MALETDGLRLERRTLDGASGVVEALAPAHWTDGQTRAWVDWAGGAADIPRAIAAHVEMLAARAVLPSAAARARFRTGLFDALLHGALAIGEPAPAPAIISGAEAIQGFLAAERGRRAAESAASALAERLQAVMDAVTRCEGDADACADPARNASLARAAEAARAAGASDLLILDALALARAGETQWAATPAAAPEPARPMVAEWDAAAPRALAAAMWETGRIAAAATSLDARRLAEGLGARRAALDLAAFWTPEGFDFKALEAAAGIAAQALGAGDEPGRIALAGLGDWLAAQGLAYDSQAARDAAVELHRRAGEAVRRAAPGLNDGLAAFEDAELARRLGGADPSARAWRGPLRSETENGQATGGLSAAAERAFAVLQVDRTVAEAALLGHRSLRDAPGIDHRALHARGFTDHEIAAAEAALPFAMRLADAFRPEVLGEGFVRDVLGASAEDIAGPDLDVLALAGFTAEAAEAAQDYALGAGSLAGAAALDLSQQAALRTAEEIGDGPYLAMLAALQPTLAAPAVAELALSWNAPPREAEARLVEAFAAGPPPCAPAARPRRPGSSSPCPRRPSRALPASPRRSRPNGSWSGSSSASGPAASCRTGARAISRKRPSAATRSICTPASTTTASWARSSSTCTRKAPPSVR